MPYFSCCLEINILSLRLSLTAEIPKDIFKGVMAGVASDASLAVLQCVTGALLQQSNVPLDRVRCSVSTASRKINESNKTHAVIAVETLN